MKMSSTKSNYWWLASGFFLTFFLATFPTTRAEQTAASQAKTLDSIRTSRTAKVTAFKAAYPRVQVDINTVTGAPEILRGDLSKGLTKTDPVVAAYEFFDLNKEMYGLSQPKAELNIKRVEKIGLTGQTMVVFRQLYEGVEIWHSDIRAIFDRAEKLRTINGTTVQGIDISTIPAFDSMAAINLAKKDLSPESKHVKLISTDLKVFPYQNKYFLAWLVKVHVDSPVGAWEYFVDASSGQILHKANRIMRINLKGNLTNATFTQVEHTTSVL